MKNYCIAVLSGDGIGPEVTAEALNVLDAVARRLDGVRFETRDIAAGAGEYLRTGDPFPEEAFEQAKGCEAILLGAMVAGRSRARGHRNCAATRPAGEA